MDLKINDAPVDTEIKEPVPGQKRRGRPRGSTNQNTQAKFAKDFAEDVNAGLKLVAMMWAAQDPICAGVLNEQSTAIAESLADLISQSARMRKMLANGIGIGKILPLLMATMPVITTVRLHHMGPREDEQQEVMGGPNNNTGWVNNIAGFPGPA